GSDTTAGGFILPNDFVDVIMSRRRDETSNGTPRDAGAFGAKPAFITETILSNVKVLAIDQATQDTSGGKNVLIGQTATLELTPKQAEIATLAQQLSDRLTLTLRSSADIGVGDEGDSEHLVF